MTDILSKLSIKTSVFTIVVLVVLVVAMMFGIPAYSRYEQRKNATNALTITKTKIQNAILNTTLTRQNDALNLTVAKATAQSQAVISSTLTPLYIQYETTQALTALAASGSNVVVYFPDSTNSLPFTTTTSNKAPSHP
jgi:uncharacterized membrane protein affecting hemolysin expression